MNPETDRASTAGSAPDADQGPRPASVGLAATLDTAAVVGFVALGRRTHDLDPGLGGLVISAAPFLIALAMAWALLRVWQRPASPLIGVGVWSITALGGLGLRISVFAGTAATAFVIVTVATTALMLIGWRLVATALQRRPR